MELGLLSASPFIDISLKGVDGVLDSNQVAGIISTLQDARRRTGAGAVATSNDPWAAIATELQCTAGDALMKTLLKLRAAMSTSDVRRKLSELALNERLKRRNPGFDPAKDKETMGTELRKWFAGAWRSHVGLDWSDMVG